MKSLKEFPFHRARRITQGEVETFRAGIEDMQGRKRRRRPGRPPLGTPGTLEQVSATLNSAALAPLRKQASKQGLHFQALINRLLINELS